VFFQPFLIRHAAHHPWLIAAAGITQTHGCRTVALKLQRADGPAFDADGRHGGSRYPETTSPPASPPRPSEARAASCLHRTSLKSFGTGVALLSAASTGPAETTAIPATPTAKILIRSPTGKTLALVVETIRTGVTTPAKPIAQPVAATIASASASATASATAAGRLWSASTTATRSLAIPAAATALVVSTRHPTTRVTVLSGRPPRTCNPQALEIRALPLVLGLGSLWAKLLRDSSHRTLHSGPSTIPRTGLRRPQYGRTTNTGGKRTLTR
jgi:hypothetical protein